MNHKMRLISMLQRERFIKWLSNTNETFEFIDPFGCPVAKYISSKFGSYAHVVVTRDLIVIYFRPKYNMVDIKIKVPEFFNDFIMYYDRSFTEYAKNPNNVNSITERVKECNSAYVLTIINNMYKE